MKKLMVLSILALSSVAAYAQQVTTTCNTYGQTTQCNSQVQQPTPDASTQYGAQAGQAIGSAVGQVTGNWILRKRAKHACQKHPDWSSVTFQTNPAPTTIPCNLFK